MKTRYKLNYKIIFKLITYIYLIAFSFGILKVFVDPSSVYKQLISNEFKAEDAATDPKELLAPELPESLGKNEDSLNLNSLTSLSDAVAENTDQGPGDPPGKSKNGVISRESLELYNKQKQLF
ncbi:MAG: hypothetical protein FJX80_07080 [Bacteroidetes bacterium]|nr:hypothetical protein [Bacteroidota bacterium]